MATNNSSANIATTLSNSSTLNTTNSSPSLTLNAPIVQKPWISEKFASLLSPSDADIATPIVESLLPQPVPFSFHPFKFFQFPFHIVVKSFILYFKYNLSLRAVTNSMHVPVSHVTTYHWIIRLSSFLHLLIPVNVFKVHVDETVIPFKARRYYVWFVVDSQSHLIFAWHVSKYRDASNVKILLSKLTSPPNILVTDHMPVYTTAVNMFFNNLDIYKLVWGKSCRKSILLL